MIQVLESKNINIPVRNQNTSKYDFGHVLVIAGSLGMLGASVLTAKSAMRIGAGLVTVCVPEGLISPAMTHFVEEMIVSVPSDFKYFFDLRSFDFLKRYLQSEDKKIDVVAIGPGLSRQKETMGFAQKMIEFLIESEIPTIIDADALFAISNTEILGNKQKNIIITPSEKEMQRLLNLPDIESVKNNRQYYCLDVAKKNGITCILKGFNTLISDGTELFINNTGNAGMATAGSGDVLTGILAGLKGQQKNLSMLEIAKTGVYLHGLAGDIAKDNVGENSLIATDLIKSLPETFKKIPLL